MYLCAFPRPVSVFSAVPPLADCQRESYSEREVDEEGFVFRLGGRGGGG